MANSSSQPYEPRDIEEFKRLRIDAVEPYDIATLRNGKRFLVLRLLATRDAQGNLRYACRSVDGNEADVYSICMFDEVLRPDIKPAGDPHGPEDDYPRPFGVLQW